MIKFVIVDDNRRHLRRTRDAIMAYMMRNKYEFDFIEFSGYTLELKKYIKQKNEDTIYILDLELNADSGIDIARYIRNTCDDWNSPIIVCSAYVGRFFEVYKERLQILDFIGKCFDIDGLFNDNLDLCIKLIKSVHGISFISKGKEYTIEYDKIDYIQSVDRKINIITKNKTHVINGTVKALKETLPLYFVDSNKGTVVNKKNIDYIDWVDMCVYFKDGKKDYVISNSHKKELKNYGK